MSLPCTLRSETQSTQTIAMDAIIKSCHDIIYLEKGRRIQFRHPKFSETQMENITEFYGDRGQSLELANLEERNCFVKIWKKKM